MANHLKLRLFLFLIVTNNVGSRQDDREINDRTEFHNLDNDYLNQWEQVPLKQETKENISLIDINGENKMISHGEVQADDEWQKVPNSKEDSGLHSHEQVTESHTDGFKLNIQVQIEKLQEVIYSTANETTESFKESIPSTTSKTVIKKENILLSQRQSTKSNYPDDVITFENETNRVHSVQNQPESVQGVNLKLAITELPIVTTTNFLLHDPPQYTMGTGQDWLPPERSPEDARGHRETLEHSTTGPKTDFRNIILSRLHSNTSARVKGIWTPWSEWSVCTPTCDIKFCTRTRICLPAFHCLGQSSEYKPCMKRSCYQGNLTRILQGRLAKLQCCNTAKCHQENYTWITPGGDTIQSKINHTRTRIYAINEFLYIEKAQNFDSGQYHCLMTAGPNVIRVDIPLLVETCPNSPCKNQGNCLETFSQPDLLQRTVCICPHSFYGARCQLEKRNVLKSSIVTIFITISTVCILIAIISFSIHCYLRERKQKKHFRSKKEIHLNFRHKDTLNQDSLENGEGRFHKLKDLVQSDASPSYYGTISNEQLHNTYENVGRKPNIPSNGKQRSKRHTSEKQGPSSRERSLSYQNVKPVRYYDEQRPKLHRYTDAEPRTNEAVYYSEIPSEDHSYTDVGPRTTEPDYPFEVPSEEHMYEEIGQNKITSNDVPREKSIDAEPNSKKDINIPANGNTVCYSKVPSEDNQFSDGGPRTIEAVYPFEVPSEEHLYEEIGQNKITSILSNNAPRVNHIYAEPLKKDINIPVNSSAKRKL